MTGRLYIAARAPRPGFTKTRMGKVIGHENAARLYRAFLADLAARFARAPFAVGWYVTPPDAWPEIRRCLWRSSSSTVVLRQPAGDWAERQRALFAAMDRRREERTVLIASDSPQLSAETVSAAFDILNERDLVLGPVHDGGYYLIGMRSPATAALFEGVQMSTDDVLRRLAQRASELGLTTGFVESTFDVDEVADLEPLARLALERSDLLATRLALRATGMHPAMRDSDQLVLSRIEADR